MPHGFRSVVPLFPAITYGFDGLAKLECGNRWESSLKVVGRASAFQFKGENIFAVQDEIALAATEALQLKLLGSNGQRIASNLRTSNPEAYRAYMQAEYFSGRGPRKEDLGKALVFTDTAIKLDEKYAPAWALRSSVQIAMAEGGLTDVTEGFRKARDDAERAIARDPTLASAYLALAMFAEKISAKANMANAMRSRDDMEEFSCEV